jgi:hypothetical protein
MSLRIDLMLPNMTRCSGLCFRSSYTLAEQKSPFKPLHFSAPSSTVQLTVYCSSRRHVHFEKEEEGEDSREVFSIALAESTCGKGPVRLDDQQTLPESTSRRATTKRCPPSRPPQPPPKRVSTSEKPLSNATNTLEKKADNRYL